MSFLLKTKLSVPAPRPNAISRSGIVRRLEEGVGLHRRMTLVLAPPGYGKTSLAAEWISRCGLKHAWITLDAGDNDPIRFLGYLAAALQSCDDSVGASVLSLLDTPQLPPAEMIAGMLVNDLAESREKLLLVLDDYQFIQNEYIHRVLQYLLDNQPQTLHLIMLSRVDPPLSLSRWRVRGQITELREVDLRFSPEEARQFLEHTAGIALEPQAVGILAGKTEGWVAGLQLAAFSLQGKDAESRLSFVRAFDGSQRYIIDYLLEEVFDRLDSGTKEFLRQTSILDRFNSALCDAVTGRDGSRQTINSLLKMNLFILPMDDQQQWYRYHALFAGILRTELAPELKGILHERASRWFDENQLPEEAVTHAIASGSWEAVIRLICKAAWSLLQQGRAVTLLKWVDALPEDKIRESTEMRAYKAWAMLLTGRGREAAALIGSIQWDEFVRNKPEAKGHFLVLQIYKAMSIKEMAGLKLSEEVAGFLESQDPVLRASALYYAAQIRLFGGKLNEAVALLEKAYRLGLDTNQHFLSLISLKNMAATMLLCGRRKEAEEVCREALQRFTDRKGKLLPLAALAFIPLGMACYAKDDLSEALEYLERGVSICQNLSLVQFAVQGEMNLAVVQFALGKYDEAFHTIRHSCEVLEAMGMSMAVPLFTAIETEFRLKQGDRKAARAWVERMGLSASHIPSHLDERQYFTYVRFLLAEGDIETARALLLNLESTARDGERVFRQITIHILRAVALKRLNREQEAAAALELAVRAAASETFYRNFLDEDPCIEGLLPAVRHVAPMFVDNLQEKFKNVMHDGSFHEQTVEEASVASKARGAGNSSLIEPLSERELEVLSLVTQGLPNQAIADRLFISLGTTKWHMTNIFTKLGVTNRVQAVEAAKRLSLLET